MLTARNVVKSLGGRMILHGASLAVEAGRITLLVGPSGSGKTTLLKCLAFLEQPDSGEIRLNGDEYRFPAPPTQVRPTPWPKLTVVFQQHFLWPHLTIRQNILMPLAWRGSTPPERFRELVDFFEMERFVDRYPNEVSVGQRQRTALARALILDPRIILLDEITSALDVEQTAKISSLLLRLRDRGIGMLLITHHLGFAYRLLARGEGDQIVFLDEGRVLEAGDLSALERPSHPRLREFLSQSDFGGHPSSSTSERNP